MTNRVATEDEQRERGGGGCIKVIVKRVCSAK